MSDLSKENWLAIKYSQKRFGLGRAGHGAFMFLQTIYQDADAKEMRDVARLIAAAPKLLAACHAAWNCISELPPTQARVEVAQMLQSAIEKAEVPEK